MGDVEKDITQILAGHTPQVEALVTLLRQLVKEAAPELVEEAKTGWGNIVYKRNGVVCAISPHKAHVNLNFYRGTDLADPSDLLEGSGKNLRHVKLHNLDDVDSGALGSLVQEAFQLNEA